jgi:hypothetical protein
MKYCLDIVMCIDSTRSMRASLEELRTRGTDFGQDLQNSMLNNSQTIDELRVKIISYRNVRVDGDQVLIESPFFMLPDENDGFGAFVRDMRAVGGSRLASSGLVALGTAIRAAWTSNGDRQRHMICLWTDKESEPLELSGGRARYGQRLPSTFEELTTWWESGMSSSRELAMIAPDVAPWTNISMYWRNAVLYVSAAETGLIPHQSTCDFIVTALTEEISLQ